MLTQDDVSEALELKVKYENNIDEIDNYIDKNFKDFAQLNAIKTYNFEEIQKYLKKDEALIYLINEEIQQAFIIKKKEAYLYSEPYLTTARTDGVLKLSKENITSDQNSKFNENVNALVFNTFFKSIISELKDIKKITILADKYYSSYPFEMMITNNPKMDIENLADIKNINKPRYLIQDYQVNYVPSIETFINLKNLTKSKINKKSLFLGVGDPKLTKLNQSKKAPDNEIKFLRGGNIDDVNKIYQNYDEIPFTGKEIKEISKVFSKSKTFLREKANEKQIKKLDLSKFNVISFATHAEVYGNFTEFNEPFLVLTPPHKSTEEDDGLLTTSEISQLDLKSDLVILSACNTSSKINKYAEGFSGLVSSFFQAGAKSIISTYWPVEDKAGYILMTKTMEKVIKKNFSVPQALQATKTEFINGKYGEEYKKPFYWAPYVYIGI